MIIILHLIDRADKELYMDLIAGFISRGLLFTCTIDRDKATITFSGGH